MSIEIGHSPAAELRHLVLLASSFPFGTGETFLEDEILILAEVIPRITILAETAEGSARDLPSNCHVVQVDHNEAVARGRLLPRVARTLVADWHEGTGLRKRFYMLRAAMYYVRNASAIVRSFRKHFETGSVEPPQCFYSYWMDHKALAATDLRQAHAGSIAISRVHGFDLNEDRHPYGYLPLRRYLVERFAAVFAVSDVGARHLRAVCPSATNIATARLGVRPIAKTPPGRDDDSEGRLTVLTVGALIPVKRIEIVVEALSGLGAQSGVSWFHFGDGPLMGTVRRDAHRTLQVSFEFAGQIRNTALRSALRRHAAEAILVNTSASEGVPVSMMEAMACGIPCVGSAVGGVTEIIEDGVNGYLLSANPSPDEVRRAIERCRDLPVTARQRLRQAAVEKWSTMYDAEKNYTSFAAELSRLVTRS